MSASSDFLLSMCIPLGLAGAGALMGLYQCYQRNNLQIDEKSYIISEPKSYETKHENVVIICNNPTVHFTVVYVQPTAESSIQT
jgi:hypothetical protein